MSVLAVITEISHARAVLSWARVIATSKNVPLRVFCWSPAQVAEFPLLATEEELAANDVLVDAARAYLTENGDEASSVTVHRSIQPDAVAAVVSEVRTNDCTLIVAAESEQFGRVDQATVESPLLRRSPCETFLLANAQEAPPLRKILIAAADSAHDRVAVDLFGHAAKTANLQVTLTHLEREETADEAVELGRRELRQLVRDAGLKSNNDLTFKVYSKDNRSDLVRDASASDLIVFGAGQNDLARNIRNQAKGPTLAVVKRAPPLTRLGKGSGRWRTKISPADYAEMMQGLRRGADLSTDFIIMLGLAAGIASLGLLQNSPAVVIGSMLLAPLMTPMIACGLAVAQANMRLGRRALLSILAGFVITLVISFVLGVATPGDEITEQIASRGNPNILDLLIAFFSASAAAYALARPNIVGAIAGVAIATALVPPLCATGISIAYGEFLSASGSAMLFVTNVFAIIFGAAVTFRLLGVTSEKAGVVQRQWVQRVVMSTVLVLVLLSYPLLSGLNRLIEQGGSQPSTYPLPQSVVDSLIKHIEQTPSLELIAAARPSARHDRADVVIFLSSPEPLPRSYADGVIKICRDEMKAPELIVEVHCLRNAWLEDNL